MIVTVFKIWVLQDGSGIIFPNLKNLSCVHKKNVKEKPSHTPRTPQTQILDIL